MAGILKTNSIQLGDSATDSQNFQLRTNVNGTATLARGAAGNLGDILTLDAAGKAAFPQMPFVGSAPVVESWAGAISNYVKFADGTLICTGSFQDGTTNWKTTAPTLTFAAAFIVVPNIQLTPFDDGTGYATAIAYYGVGLTSFRIKKSSGVTDIGTSLVCNYIAFGRWKA